MCARGILLQNLESKEDKNFEGSTLDTDESLSLDPFTPLFAIAERVNVRGSRMT